VRRSRLDELQRSNASIVRVAVGSIIAAVMSTSHRVERDGVAADARSVSKFGRNDPRAERFETTIA
jgi:hypothetical protein